MIPPYIPNRLLCVFPRIICFLFFGSFVSGFELHADKVVSSVIIASVEGEVTSYNMIDDFKVTIGPKSVGRKMSSKSLISTGKTGKIAILFSNGALFTIKPGSRFYLRKYKQLEGVVEGLPAPGKLDAEPTQSELSAHLDYGELVVKAPKLKKGSSMKVTSPLGTAGIRGTMFQFMAVRNSVTGDISGGINLISGDIDFTDTNGNPVTLVSGQSLQVGTNRLGETVASQSGELVNLSATYGNALTLGFVPPTLQMVFPNLVNDLGEPIDQDSLDQGDDFSTIPPVAATGFDFIQSIATEIFFEIESAEVSSAEFSFESMQLAVEVEAPIPQTESPAVPTVIAGDPVIADILRVVKGDHPNVQLLGDESMSIEMTDLPFSDFDPWITAEDFLGGSISGSANLLNPPDLKIPGTYQLVYSVSDIAGSSTSISRTVEVIATPPSIALFPGRLGMDDSKAYLWQVKSRQSGYPLQDDGPFEVMRSSSSTNPYVTASYYDGTSLVQEVNLSGSQVVDYSVLGSEKSFSVSVSDLSLRRVNFPNGSPVESTLQPIVRIVDRLEPIIQINSGTDTENLHTVTGQLDTTFQDPGITLLDNYYSQAEMENHLGISSGLNDSKIIPDEFLFGSVNMEVAGIYELTYQGISDPSGNFADPVTRFVYVEDGELPIVTLNGDSLENIDLNATLLDPSSYSDQGAFATDNLLRESTDWKSLTLEWSVSIQESVYGTDNWQSPFAAGTTMEGIIAEIHEEKVAQSPLKFKVTYSVRDKAGNVGFAERIVVLKSSPYQEPQINVSISSPWVQNGSSDSIPIVKGHVQGGSVGDTVSELPGEGTLASSVTAQIYYDADDIRSLSYSISKYLIDATGNETDVTDTFDISKVNFYDSGIEQYYVDPEGNFYPEDDTGWRMLVVRYTTETAMDKTDSTDLIIRIEDTTPPEFDLVGSTSLTVEAGSVYQDGSFDDNITNISDNYDIDISIAQKTSHIEYIGGGSLDDPLGGNIFDILTDSNIGFWVEGSYRVLYEIRDDFNNSESKERTITVEDTTPPYIDLITHSDLGSYTRISGRSVFSADHASSPDISSRLSGSTFASDGSAGSVYVLQSPDDNSSFYFRLSDVSNIDNVLEDNGLLNDTAKDLVGIDSYGRSFKWHSAFAFKDSGGTEFFQDPGVYVENLSDATTNISSTIEASYDDPVDGEEDNGSQLRQLTVTYDANDGGSSSKTRDYFFLDEEIPQIFLSPSTSIIGVKLILEAGEFYNDANGESYDLTDGSTTTLSKRAFDIIDGNLSGSIVSTFYSGLHDENTIGAATQVLSIDSSVPEATYTIRYDVNDIQQDGDTGVNAAISQFRHIIVKDRIAPTISIISGGSDILLNNIDPDAMDEAYVKNLLLEGMVANDYRSVDTQLDTSVNRAKWEVYINTSPTFSTDDTFVPGGIYPERNDTGDPGYSVWFTITDSSSNESNKKDDNVSVIQRNLKLGDFRPPVITLIGESTVHDFLRYGQNSNLTNNEQIFDQPGTDFNSSGFGGGAHRLILADYNFVDPGAYAEDGDASNPSADRGSFDKTLGYPDLNGNGVGETHVMSWTNSYSDMELCTNGPGIIHVYSKINRQTEPISYFQENMASDSPSFLADGNFTISDNYDLNGSSDQVRRTHFKIYYRVKDGWGNKSNIVDRDVYIYESVQVAGTAFYATPLDVTKGALYDRNNSNDPRFFLTSAEKDSDGDGFSDFWEVAYGTRPDLSTDFPDINNSTLNSEIYNNSATVHTRLQVLPDYNSSSNLSTFLGL